MEHTQDTIWYVHELSSCERGWFNYPVMMKSAERVYVCLGVDATATVTLPRRELETAGFAAAGPLAPIGGHFWLKLPSGAEPEPLAPEPPLPAEPATRPRRPFLGERWDANQRLLCWRRHCSACAEEE